MVKWKSFKSVDIYKSELNDQTKFEKSFISTLKYSKEIWIRQQVA